MNGCARRWEAEAVEDGRLDGAGRASFERHTSTCLDCSREVEILAQLRTAGELPFVPLRAMDRRRRRAVLLWHANQEILGMPRRARARRVGAFAATLLFVGAGFAEWREWHAGRLAMTRALATGDVAPTAEPVRELRGTATEERSAEADSRAPQAAGPADSRAPQAAGPADSRADLAEAETGQDVAKARAASRKKRGAARVHPAASPRENRAPEADPGAKNAAVGEGAKTSAEPAGGEAGMLFASAMHAFDAGTYRKADELFHRFSQRFSEDPRAEDASFLRVVCALRLGDRAAVEAHAHEYLGAHPQGLRRQEVERLLY